MLRSHVFVARRAWSSLFIVGQPSAAVGTMETFLGGSICGVSRRYVCVCVWVVFLLGCIREENYPCGVLVGFGLVGLDDALRDPALLLRLFNPFSNTSIRKATLSRSGLRWSHVGFSNYKPLQIERFWRSFDGWGLPWRFGKSWDPSGWCVISNTHLVPYAQKSSPRNIC